MSFNIVLMCLNCHCFRLGWMILNMKNFPSHLKKKFLLTSTFKELVENVEQKSEVQLMGVFGAAKSLFLQSLYDKFERPVLFISYSENEAENVKDDLLSLGVEDELLFFPPIEIFPHKQVYSDDISVSYRMSTFEKLAESTKYICISTSKALSKIFSENQTHKRKKEIIKKGKEKKFDSFIAQLSDFGYQRQSLVDRMGEFCVRGGIIDVFPFSSENPLRIEFWGNEVESIREFDLESQRSIKSVDEVVFFPIEKDEMETTGSEKNIFSEKRIKIENSFFGLLSKNTIVVLEEPKLILKEIDDLQVKIEKYYHLGETDFSNVTRRSPYFISSEINQFISGFQKINMTTVEIPQITKIEFQIKSQPNFNGNLKFLESHLYKIHEKKNGVSSEPSYFLCDYDEQANRMKELFEDLKIPTHIVQTVTCGLNSGFSIKEVGLDVITDSEFYGRKKQRKIRKKFKKGLTQDHLKTIKKGDFVVHEDYGIGIYYGLRKIRVGDNERECIKIIYKDNDVVYVPLDRMMRVQKYSAKEGTTPVLNKLGGNEWEKLKTRTKKKIQDIAKDLIAIYATRKAMDGFSFSKDSIWQKELEASFPYEDTRDQVQVTNEIKNDMESKRPMDRLICGDVGFGKTELAIRAAFKAVNDSKQVAVLAPTTILAHQHYRTFKSRVKNFPVQVDVISRFRLKKDVDKIIEKTSSGKIDILIGTHKILSNKLKFNNLGLLIVDEEQRFGVKQKEKLKSNNKTVDVITLTATPIPRTLHLSLMGARDMSVINTAPKDRLPITTEIVEFDSEVIREAILREIHRGGQVFFVHNRVYTINSVAAMIKRIVPEVKVAVAHGQMAEQTLERVMLKFLEKKYDVLVCTKIIENGLDIPNVNTILIHRADRFGLAELYQLRGRVGRSSERAFAYLIVPPVQKMSPVALKRIQTIQEFTDLGTGYQVAMRDLEIRGAGNLLGSEQSGFIAALGFELYCKILDDAVQEITQKKMNKSEDKFYIDPIDVYVEVNEDVYIPDYYMERGDVRLEYYRRMVVVKSSQDLRAIQEEIIDIFGKMPIEVLNLFNILDIKIKCGYLGIAKVFVTAKKVSAEFIPDFYEKVGPNFRAWAERLVRKATLPIEFVPRDILMMRIIPEKNKFYDLETIKKFLQSLD